MDYAVVVRGRTIGMAGKKFLRVKSEKDLIVIQKIEGEIRRLGPPSHV
jgi:hypothetical protein